MFVITEVFFGTVGKKTNSDWWCVKGDIFMLSSFKEQLLNGQRSIREACEQESISHHQSMRIVGIILFDKLPNVVQSSLMEMLKHRL